jgi:gas vesicle protein
MDKKALKDMVRAMIDAHKTSFDNFFSTMIMYQNQNEKILNTFIDNTPGISDQGRKVLTQWSEAYEKGIDDFKEAIDDGYTRVETLFDLDAMFIFSEQTEKMLNTFTSQNYLMPQNYLRNAMREWVNLYNKSMKTAEYFLSVSDKQHTRTKPKK